MVKFKKRDCIPTTMAVTNHVINKLSEVLLQHCLFCIIHCTYLKNEYGKRSSSK
jgi:hypothetical protein